jgi:lipoyl synthase
MGKFSNEAGREALDGHQRLPPWIAKERAKLSELHVMKAGLREKGLHTVCEEARCPNRANCFGRDTAAFLLMGNVCTRDCGFCAIAYGSPRPPDHGEPIKVARQAAALGLKYAVLTSVTRDDLADGGAAHFAATIRAVKENGALIEVLVPDFRGDLDAVARVVGAGPAVFNHNLETVPDFYPSVRSKADYGRSLKVLTEAKRIGSAIFGEDFRTKSGLMLGLGETEDQLTRVFKDLVGAGVGILTLGQYLRPTRHQLPVREYVHPDTFGRLGKMAREIGIGTVFSGPLVRSSFSAEETFGAAVTNASRLS